MNELVAAVNAINARMNAGYYTAPARALALDHALADREDLIVALVAAMLRVVRP